MVEKFQWINNVYVWDMDCWNCKRETTVLQNSSEYFWGDRREGITTLGNLSNEKLIEIADKFKIPYKIEKKVFFCICIWCDITQGTYYLNNAIVDNLILDGWIEKNQVYSKKGRKPAKLKNLKPPINS